MKKKKKPMKALTVLAGYKKPKADTITGLEKYQLPQGYLSPSQIEMYLRCPRQYMFRYIDGKKSPPGVALTEGSAHHEAMKVNNEHKKKKGRDLRPKAVFETFADHFSDHKREVEDWGTDTTETVVERGESMITAYMKSQAPKIIMPTHIEEEVWLDVGGIKVMGYIDLVAKMKQVARKQNTVVDYKAVGKKKSEGELKGSIQLSFYPLAAKEYLGEDPKQVGFMNLIKNGTVAWQPTPITPGRTKWFKEIVKSVAAAISAGNFPVTAPANWCCDPRWCGYYAQCRGKYE